MNYASVNDLIIQVCLQFFSKATILGYTLFCGKNKDLENITLASSFLFAQHYER